MGANKIMSIFFQVVLCRQILAPRVPTIEQEQSMVVNDCCRVKLTWKEYGIFWWEDLLQSKVRIIWINLLEPTLVWYPMHRINRAIQLDSIKPDWFPYVIVNMMSIPKYFVVVYFLRSGCFCT